MASLTDREPRPTRNLGFSIIDFVPRVLLVIIFGYAGLTVGSVAIQRLGMAVDKGWLSDTALQAYPILGKAIFMIVIVVLALIRARRIAGDDRIYAQIVALAGTFFLILVPLVSARTALPQTIAVTSSVLMLIGSIASIAVVVRLGRSFSIMPEARQLVVTGPYRFVRHPLYFVEELMMVGIFITYPLGWTIFMILGHGLLQLERMRLEEQVLRRNFPDYAAYAERTARLIPGIY